MGGRPRHGRAERRGSPPLDQRRDQQPADRQRPVHAAMAARQPARERAVQPRGPVDEGDPVPPQLDRQVERAAERTVRRKRQSAALGADAGGGAEPVDGPRTVARLEVSGGGPGHARVEVGVAARHAQHVADGGPEPEPTVRGGPRDAGFGFTAPRPQFAPLQVEQRHSHERAALQEHVRPQRRPGAGLARRARAPGVQALSAAAPERHELSGQDVPAGSVASPVDPRAVPPLGHRPRDGTLDGPATQLHG